MGQDLLTPNQLRLLERAAADKIITDSFYLTGGTALMAFYTGHRFSEDLDFFTESPIDEIAITSWVKKTKKALSADATFQRLRGQFIYYFHFPKDTVKIDFAYFPFPHAGTFKKFKSLRVANIEDIGINKLQAITSRTRGRDYVDLYEILHQPNISLSILLKLYQIKFDTSISIETLAKQFQSVIEASDQPMFLGTRNWKEIEEFFLNESKKIGKLMLH